MRLTPPKKWTFWVSAFLALLGLIGFLVTVPFLTTYAFWFVFIGYVVLFLGLVLKGF